MNTNRSVLSTIITRVRTLLDEPDVDAKFSDAYLAAHIIPGSLANVINKLAHDWNNPVLVPYSVAVTTDVSRYKLPAHIGKVRGIIRRSTDGRIIEDLRPRDWSDWRGRGWAIEGTELVFDPRPAYAETYTLEYEPGSVVSPHYSTGGTLASNLTTLTLDNSPDLGLLDLLEGSYLGQEVRIINTTGNIVEQFFVVGQGFAGGNHTLTLNRPAAHATAGTVTYEVMPLGLGNLMDAVVCDVCLTIAVARNYSEKRWQYIVQRYKSAFKTTSDRYAQIQGRVPVGMGKLGRDAPRNPLDTGGREWWN